MGVAEFVVDEEEEDDDEEFGGVKLADIRK
jgi:hypothetical protein